MLSIDRIAYQSKLVNVAPEIKGIAYLVLLILMFQGTPLIQATLFAILAVVTIYTANITIKRYVKWILLPLPFILISFITIIFSVTDTDTNLLVSVSVFGKYMGLNQEALPMAYSLFFRALGCLACTFLFSVSVPFNQMLLLLKKCRLPSVLIEITMLMYRFIFILIEETANIYHAQQMRYGFRTLKTSYHSFGLLLKVLFVQSFDRYEKMVVSLEMKYFQGDFPLH